MTHRTLDDHLRENSSDEDCDDDLALLTRKFKKFIKRNKFKNDTENKLEPKKDQVICYECKKPGHYKSDCPQSKKRTSKKKALKATWDDSSASEEEESNTEQVAHYALMAIREEVTNLIDADLSFDELLNAFHDLFDECKIISRKYKLLKNKHDSLVRNFDKLKTEYHDSLAQCEKCHDLETLQKENLLLKDTLMKFEVGSKSLNMILTNKGHVPKRSGIGFVRSPHQNPTTFIKGPILHVRH